MIRMHRRIPRDPARALLALLGAQLLLACAADEPLLDLSEGRPNVIFIVLDTFRADHLGCYGNEFVQTPNIDQLAAESILFERASSNAPWTLPSMASLYTGRLPFEHGALGGSRTRLGSSPPTLAGTLGRHGYTTAAFVGVDWLGDEFGLDRGFIQMGQRFIGLVSTRSEKVLPLFYRHLRAGPAEPFFMLGHIFDAHAPYRPPAPFDRMYYDGDPHDPANDSAAVLYGPNNRIQKRPEARYGWLEGVTDLRFGEMQYAAGITHVDHTVGALLDSLRAAEQLDDNIVVLLADHGEHLTEHDIYFTHRFPYEECLHVPLLIRLPGGKEGGRRVSDEVSHVDIFPTLMELLGLPLPEPRDGRSLVPLMSGRRGGPSRLQYAESGAAKKNIVRAVWDENYRLIEFNLNGVQTFELYDRRADRRERTDIASERPEQLRRLAVALRERFGDRSLVASEAGDVEDSGPIDADVEARLKALGYLD